MNPSIHNVQDRIRPAVLDRIVKLLENGGVAIVPTDTVYGLVTKAFDQETYKRLDHIKGRRTLPYVVVFKSLNSLVDWYGNIDPFRMRIMRKLLPGPVTFVLPVKPDRVLGFRYDDAGIGIRVCSDSVLAMLCDRLGEPLWATSANHPGEFPPMNFSDIQQMLLAEVDMAIDGGPTSFREASTSIDLREQPYKILRAGPWVNRIDKCLKSADEPLEVLVVCSGNICRSPIGEMYLQHFLGSPDQSGVHVSSAGTIASNGYPAMDYMIDIANAEGLNLADHRSRRLTSDIVKESDLILVATESHRDAIIRSEPEHAGKVRLMAESIGEVEIPDPYSRDRETYNRIAKIVKQAAEGWTDRIRRFITSGVVD